MARQVTVGFSETMYNALAAKAAELNMDASDYVELALMVANSLPTQLLFVLSEGVPVHFDATAYVGGVCDDGI